MIRFESFIINTLLMLLLPTSLAAQPLIDAHLHYDAEAAKIFDTEDIIDKLDQNDIRSAVVMGTSSQIKKLHRYAPERIIPFLSITRSQHDKVSWIDDSSIPKRLAVELDHGDWQGIGELHVFAKNRHSPVLKQVIEIASARKLPVLLHSDPSVIDIVYDIAPDVKIIWAHAGTFPYPDLVADYLRRYPDLSVDLSMRDQRIAPEGEIDDAWYELFLDHPDRFMTGVDTHTLSRWHDFPSTTSTIRSWLSKLPDDIASQIGYKNAAELFDINEYMDNQ